MQSAGPGPMMRELGGSGSQGLTPLWQSSRQEWDICLLNCVHMHSVAVHTCSTILCHSAAAWKRATSSECEGCTVVEVLCHCFPSWADGSKPYMEREAGKHCSRMGSAVNQNTPGKGKAQLTYMML